MLYYFLYQYLLIVLQNIINIVKMYNTYEKNYTDIYC